MHLDLENGTTANNWIIGTHLLLAGASYLALVKKSAQAAGSQDGQSS
jgi:hypothetical protein